jgi:hypothetical protein
MYHKDSIPWVPLHLIFDLKKDSIDLFSQLKLVSIMSRLKPLQAKAEVQEEVKEPQDGDRYQPLFDQLFPKDNQNTLD